MAKIIAAGLTGFQNTTNLNQGETHDHYDYF